MCDFDFNPSEIHNSLDKSYAKAARDDNNSNCTVVDDDSTDDGVGHERESVEDEAKPDYDEHVEIDNKSENSKAKDLETEVTCQSDQLAVTIYEDSSAWMQKLLIGDQCLPNVTNNADVVKINESKDLETEVVHRKDQLAVTISEDSSAWMQKLLIGDQCLSNAANIDMNDSSEKGVYSSLSPLLNEYAGQGNGDMINEQDSFVSKASIMKPDGESKATTTKKKKYISFKAMRKIWRSCFFK